MSFLKTIAEYREMVKNGIKNGDKIFEAIRTSAKVKEKSQRLEDGENDDDINISDEAIAVILKRKEICAGCPFNSRIAADKRNYSHSLPFEHCILCKCRIGYEDSKEYCLSCECGMSVWNERNKDKPPMELKWKAFNKETNQEEQ